MRKRVLDLGSTLERLLQRRRRRAPRARRSLLALSGMATLLVALVGVPLFWLAARLDRRLPFRSGWDTPTGEPPGRPIEGDPFGSLPAGSRHEHLERHGPHGV